MRWESLDGRPVVVAVAWPKGAEKTTFYHAHLKPAGLRFVNVGVLARELDMDSYPAARVAESLRQEWVNQGRASFLKRSFRIQLVTNSPS